MGLFADSGTGRMYVEFFGLPRERAGVPAIELQANTLGELLAVLAERVPPLSEFVEANRLHPVLAASLNGDRFIRDPQTPLCENDHVLILSADAGG